MTFPERGTIGGPGPGRAMSFDAEHLAKRLSALAVGETVSYAELSALVGANVQRERRSALDTARRHLLRTQRFVLEAERNVGIKRVDGHELVAVVTDGMARGRRHFARVCTKSMACTSEGYAGLAEDDRVRLDASRSIAAAIRKLASAPAIKRVEGAIDGRAALPTAETLKLFTK